MKTETKWKAKKSWREKMKVEQEPKIVKLPPEGWQRMGGRTMLVSTPHDVDALIRKIPKGKVATSAQLRQKLAEDAGAECACPTSTGIFVRIAAEAAEEAIHRRAALAAPVARLVRKAHGLRPTIDLDADRDDRRFHLLDDVGESDRALRALRISDAGHSGLGGEAGCTDQDAGAEDGNGTKKDESARAER